MKDKFFDKVGELKRLAKKEKKNIKKAAKRLGRFS